MYLVLAREMVPVPGTRYLVHHRIPGTSIIRGKKNHNDSINILERRLTMTNCLHFGSREIVVFWIFLCYPFLSRAYDNGIGLTPPMGWNSWNRFGCHIEEQLIKETAQAAVDLGLKDIGYKYINLDDCWQISRNESGYIEADPTRFPSGLSSLADTIHSLGLLFGLYSDAGTYTCAHRPGSLGYERQDAESYVHEFHADYLKYDNCYNHGVDVKQRYQTMHDALNETGRPIFFSMCEWGIENPASWAKPVANSWRTTSDIRSNWNSFTDILDINDRKHSYASPGGWNDPDMLEVGNGGLSEAEERSHFTLWALMKAPLLLGNDLRDISNETLSIISNEEIIAINQDPMGVQGYKRSSNQGLEVWAGPLALGDVAVVLFNRSSRSASITANWNDIGIASNTTQMHVRDLWKHTSLGTQQGCVTALVESHDVVAIRLTPALSNMKESLTTL